MSWKRTVADDGGRDAATDLTSIQTAKSRTRSSGESHEPLSERSQRYTQSTEEEIDDGRNRPRFTSVLGHCELPFRHPMATSAEPTALEGLTKLPGCLRYCG
jgi:hypothetical protein